MTYDPISFWQEQGKTYLDEYEHNHVYKRQEYVLIEYLHNLEFETVLELGCGFGRLSKLVYDEFKPRVYYGIDVSLDQLQNLRKYVGDRNIPTRVCSILDFELIDKYDLVLSAEVLMHQLPSDMEAIIAKMKSWSKKHIINIDYFADEEIELANYNFKHDYIALYGNPKMIQIDRQTLFHYSV